MRPKDLLPVIRRRLRFILLVTGVTAVVAVGISLLRGPAYRAEARVMIAATDAITTRLDLSQTGLSAQQVDLLTQVDLIGSPPFVQGVIGSLGLKTTPEYLMTRVSVSLVGQTSIIAIDVTDREPARAVNTANAFARTYVDWSRDRERASAKAAGNAVESRLATAQAQIAALEARRGAASGVAQAQLQAAKASYAALSVRLEDLRLAEQIATGVGVAMPATIADAVPVATGPLRGGALGLAVGLLGGLGLALVLEFSDDSIRNSDEAAVAYGAPVLAHIPPEPAAQRGKSRLAVVDLPRGPAAEAYRVLRNGLDFVSSQRRLTSVLVTSAGPDEGGSAVAANLAAVLAQAGKRTVLLTCDFHRPTDDQYFDVDGTIGLSGVLDGSVDASSALQRPTGFDKLAVLTAGKAPPNPSELVSSASMGSLISVLSDRVDWVILDGPPLLLAADAAAIARWTDGVLLVSRSGVSSREAAAEARAQLDNVGAHIPGVVLWDH